MNEAPTATVLVTGSSRGIGRAIALRLARDGFDIVVHCRSGREAAQQTAQAIQALGRQARVLQFDVADRNACALALEADMTAHGAYYGVVCNAGMAQDNAFPAMTGEEWDAVVHTNLDAFYNVLHPIVMPMVRRRKPGRIVTLASVSALMGNRGQTNYSAAKAGVIAATKSLAIELAKREITVNCVAPGFIETEMVASMKPEALEKMTSGIPLKRLGQPKEIAHSVAYILENDYYTGRILELDGGLRL